MCILLFFCTLPPVRWAIAQDDVQRIFILKEIDDDNIIILTQAGDKILLKKWSMRFSPSAFEGKHFYASISTMWVTIYIENKSPIKWSIEKNLGRGSSETKRPKKATVYPGVGSKHWIQKVIDGGKLILLEDGSMWEVSPLDIVTTCIWLPVSDISVVSGKDPVYPYMLINTDDGEMANAKYVDSD